MKRPTTSKKQHETTYKDLKRLATNKKRPGNDLRITRNNLKQPTTSKIQPIMTWTYLQQAKKDAKRQATSRFWDYFTIWGKRFSSLIDFPSNIWLQSFEHCFTENHGHIRASNISLVSCVFFMGYSVYFFLSGFRVKNINKSQNSRERERLFFFCSSMVILSTTFTRFGNRSVFNVYSYWGGLMMNEDVASGSRNRTIHSFISKPL